MGMGGTVGGMEAVDWVRRLCGRLGGPVEGEVSGGEHRGMLGVLWDTVGGSGTMEGRRLCSRLAGTVGGWGTPWRLRVLRWQ